MNRFSLGRQLLPHSMTKGTDRRSKQDRRKEHGSGKLKYKTKNKTSVNKKKQGSYSAGKPEKGEGSSKKKSSKTSQKVEVNATGGQAQPPSMAFLPGMSGGGGDGFQPEGGKSGGMPAGQNHAMFHQPINNKNTVNPTITVNPNIQASISPTFLHSNNPSFSNNPTFQPQAPPTVTVNPTFTQPPPQAQSQPPINFNPTVYGGQVTEAERTVSPTVRSQGGSLQEPTVTAGGATSQVPSQPPPAPPNSLYTGDSREVPPNSQANVSQGGTVQQSGRVLKEERCLKYHRIQEVEIDLELLQNRSKFWRTMLVGKVEMLNNHRA